VIISSPSVAVTNSGSIIVNSQGVASGVTVASGALSFTNAASAAINVTGNTQSATALTWAASNSNIVNNGAITATDTTNAVGISWASGFLNSTLTNTGTISASGPNGSSSGTSVAISVGSLGIASSISTITNQGTISGYTAITNAGNEPLSIVNGGTIQGYISFGGSLGSVTNTGLIDGPIQFGLGTETAADAALGITSQTVSNSMTIDGSITGAVNVLNNGTIAGNISSVAVTNTSIVNGTVVAGSTVSNSGTINGPAQAGVALENSGHIVGSVGVGSGGQITNTGDLAGGIDLTNISATVDSRGGTVEGNIILSYDPYAGASFASGAFNDVIYTGSQGGSILIGAAVADPSQTATIVGGAGGQTVIHYSEDRALATLTLNADGGWTVAAGNEGTETLYNVQTLQFADQAFNLQSFQTQTSSVVTGLYDTFFGRAPAVSELDFWVSAIANGASASTLRTDLVSDPNGVAYINSQVAGLYDTFFGRAPTAGEASFWLGDIQAGDGFGAVRSALVSDPNGVSYIDGQVTSLYETYFGRAPGAGELSFWLGDIQAGDGFGAVRATLVNDPNGVAYIDGQITSLYDTYFGRDPSAGEQSFWLGDIQQGGSFASLQSALVSDPNGQAHTAAEVTSLYDTYFGRDPSAAEQSLWDSFVLGGGTFSTVRSALVDAPAGQAHTMAEVTSLYDTFFGRAPAAAEQSFWDQAILGSAAGGVSFDQLRDVLEQNPASAGGGVAQLTGSTQSDLIVFQPSYTNVVVQQFDPATDAFKLSSSEFSGLNPLDSAHAHEIDSLGGQIDTLIQLDPTHSILLENTRLASLSANDFIFG